MTKNVLWMYAVLAGISVLFICLSIFIYFFGAKPGLVAKKIRLGTMIISLNALIAGCYAETIEGVPNGKSDDTSTADAQSASAADSDTALDTDTDTDTGDAPIVDTDVMCYDPIIQPTDVECYDAPYFPTDTDDVITETDVDTDTGDAPATDTDVMCYDLSYPDTGSASEALIEDKESPDVDTEAEAMDAGAAPRGGAGSKNK